MGGKANHPSSSESDDWGDESWIVDCPCGVNYDDGEEMVECDECGVWVHTSCCRVPKGLPTYVCDKCKIKKKLKETEESEVAQLLAELPGKPVSFDERNNHHERAEACSGGHQSSLEIPIEERAYVHGIPGGDLSFFVGVSRVFCRQLWKYTGYVPKCLKVDDRELPEPREDVREFLRDNLDSEVPLSVVDSKKLAPVALENGHAPPSLLQSDMGPSRDGELAKQEARVHEEVVKDMEGKTLQVKKEEGKHGKHRHKPKAKEERPHHYVKRARDESLLKESASKKKTRSNGEVCKPEAGLWRKVDLSPTEEAGFVGKSPLSSPKNPKAMKKLAVQEFMDGDVILCSICAKVEPVLDLVTGNAAGGRAESLCQVCERLRVNNLIVPPKLEPGSLKEEPVALTAPSVNNTSIALEARLVLRRELDYCEAGVRSGRFRADGNQASVDGDRQPNCATEAKDRACTDCLGDAKRFDANSTDLNKNSVIHDNVKVREERKFPTIKMESNVATSKQTCAQSEAEEIFEDMDVKPGAPQGLESSVSKISGSKGRGESVVKAEDVRGDVPHVLVIKASCASETEAHSLYDHKIATCGDKQVDIPESLSTLAQPSPERPQVLPAVSVGAGFILTEPVDRNGSPPVVVLGSVSSATVETATVEDRTHKFPTSVVSMETKGQGSARTAGHLPASIRGKMHGERSNQQLQRSVPTGSGQQQGTSPSGQSLVQPSMFGVPRSGQNSVIAAIPPTTKVGCGEDPPVGKQHGQAHLESISPTQQVGKQVQLVRLLTSQTAESQKCPSGEVLSPSQPSFSDQVLELDQPVRSKGQQGALEHNRNEFLNSAVSPKKPHVPSVSSPDAQDLKVSSPFQATPTQVLCQQARQLNGIGHVYTSRYKANAGSAALSASNCKSSSPSGASLTSQVPNAALSNAKLSVSSLKSPSSGTSSSSPTSPLVTTPSSKPQPMSVKGPSSPPPQKSLSGVSMPNASNSVPHLSSKFSNSLTSSTSCSKQVSTLHSSKPIPSLPASPLSSKVGSMSKQSSRTNSLPVSKAVDVISSAGKSATNVGSSRGANQCASSSVGLSKDITKNVTHASSKPSTTGKTRTQPVVTKPPSSKSSHSHVPAKGSSGTSVSKHHSGPGSGTSKGIVLPGTTKHTSAHQSKVGMVHKDEKSSMPPAPPVSKAMSTMPPPPPQVSTKRSPPTVPTPTVLTSSVATTLKDEELALLLHQELNSSPRVPRVPRVRQAGASLQLVSSPSLSSAKGSFTSATSGGSSHKDHHPGPRKRTREDRHKDFSKIASHSAEEVGKGGAKRSEENKIEDWKGSVEKVGNCGTIDGSNIKEKSSVSGSLIASESNARHHGFAKGNLSIIVPANDDPPDGDKKSSSPADNNNVVTLPGLIDEVLSNRGHQLSYEDVCDAVLPHWQKLRKPNGERYAYASHRQAVLDCLRNRSAWSHLVNRGPKTNLGRKRRRNDSTTVSDTDEDEEHISFRDTDELETIKYSKRSKGSEGEKWEAPDIQKSAEAATPEDVPKGKRKARRRRKVAIEDGTDGEDDEPTSIVERGSGKAGLSKGDGGIIQDEDLEAESSPSSEEAVSNYSEEDEEMVVHRGKGNRRRPADESSGSEDDID